MKRRNKSHKKHSRSRGKMMHSRKNKMSRFRQRRRMRSKRVHNKTQRRNRIQRRNRTQRGGWGLSSLLPQQLVNTWRGMTGSVSNLGYKFAGLKPPDSNYSSPTHQPIDKLYKYVGTNPPNVNSIRQNAIRKVDKLLH